MVCFEVYLVLIGCHSRLNAFVIQTKLNNTEELSADVVTEKSRWHTAGCSKDRIKRGEGTGNPGKRKIRVLTNLSHIIEQIMVHNAKGNDNMQELFLQQKTMFDR